MKRMLVVAVMMMMACMGAWAQDANGTQVEQAGDSTANVGTELAVNKEGKRVLMWDLKVDEEGGDVSYVIYMDGAKAGELWSWCRMWLAENVEEYNRIKQIEDRSEGRLVVNFTSPINLRAKSMGYDTKWMGSQTWKMTIQCKDERFRVKMTEYTSMWIAQALILGEWSEELLQFNESKKEAAERMGEPFEKLYKEVIASVIKSQGEYLKKMSEEDDDF